jgi:hypothetical protein
MPLYIKMSISLLLSVQILMYEIYSIDMNSIYIYIYIYTIDIYITYIYIYVKSVKL